MRSNRLHIILLLLLFFPLWGELRGASICEKLYTSGASKILLSCETNHFGDVVITIKDGQNCTGTAWRGSGIKANNANNPGPFLVVVGTTTYPATNYFTVEYTAGTPYYILRLKPGVTLPAGANIRLTNATFEWRSDQNTNAYIIGASGFDYTYGAVCGTLDAPILQSVGDNAPILFSSVTGADYYLYHVYNGREQIAEGLAVSGQTFPFHPYMDATYEITVSAHTNSGNYSAESNGIELTMEGNPAYLPASELCAEPFGPDGAALTWETDMDGNIVITISGETGTAFRSNGMGSNLNDFTVDGQPASNWFNRVYQGAGSVTYTLQLKNPANHPVYGSVVRYRGNAGYIEYKAPQNNNAYGKYNFDYVYGTVCPRLTAPEILSVTSNGVITFTSVPYAEQYEVMIYRGELVVGTYTITSGSTLPFTPLITYPYTLYVRALATDMVPSPLSEPYVWQASGVEQEPTNSTLCEKRVSSDNGGIYLTVETMPSGDIQLRLSGPNNPVWRNEGIKTSAMLICGYPIDDYFDKDAKSVYEGQSVMTLRLKSSARGVFALGDVIEYKNQHLEWFYNYVPGATANPQGYVLNYMFTYVYGTDCNPIAERLPVPEIASISASGLLTISPVVGATGYEIRIEDADGDLVGAQLVNENDSILRGQSILQDFAYCVRVRALAATANARPSQWSDCFTWIPGEVVPVQPDEPGSDDDDIEDGTSTGKPAEPTTPTTETEDHDYPEPPVVPEVVDTLAGATDTVPPILPRDTIFSPDDPDTIPVFVVDTLADDTDPIPPLPGFMDAEVLFEDPLPHARKVIENGQVFIYIDDRKYNLWGQLVK